MKDFFISTFKTAIAAALLFAAGKSLNLPFSLGYAIAIPIVAAIASVNIMHGITLTKKTKQLQYNSEKNLPFIKNRTVPYLITVLAVFVLTFFVIVRLNMFSGFQWVALLILPPIFILSKKIANKICYYLYNQNYAPNKSRRLTYILTSVIMTVAFTFTVYFAEGVNVGSIPENISYKSNPVAYSIASFFKSADDIFSAAFSAGTELGISNYAMISATVLGGSVFFYLIINFFGFFLLNKEEMLSVIKPLNGGTIKKTSKFIYAFVTTIFIFFIYPALFASIQIYADSNFEAIQKAEELAKIPVEFINGTAHRLGTLKKIQFEKAKFYGKSKEELEKAIDNAYDEMIVNTDKYLDWYYSLPAEYGRLFKLLTGSLEDYLKEHFINTMTPSDNISAAFEEIQKNSAELSKRIEKILAENKVEYKNGDYSIVIDVNFADIYKNGEIPGILDLKKRLGISAGGGAAAGAIAGAAASKIAAKTGFKTAAKAVAKAAAGKAASAAVGAGVGILTSFFTTPVGGIAIGTAAGLAIDTGLLSLEELISREEFKNQLTTDINELRAEAKDALNSAFEDED